MPPWNGQWQGGNNKQWKFLCYCFLSLGNLAQIITTTGNTNNYPDANVAIDGDDDTCIQAAWSNAQQPLPKYWHGQLRDYTYIVGFVIKQKKAKIGKNTF